MSKRISLLFVFLLFFQTITNGFIAPAQIKAEGSKNSVFTDITLTDKDGQKVTVAELDAESTVYVHVNWSIAHAEVEEGDTDSFSLPDDLHMVEKQQGELTNDETKVGIYQTATNGTVTVTFNEAVNENPEANGKFVVKAVLAAEEQADQSEKARGVSNQETDNPEQKEVKAADESDKQLLKTENIIEEDNALEEDITTSDALEIETFEVKDLGNIFTFKSFALNGNEIEDGAVIDIDEGTVIQIEFDWETDGNAKNGDTASIQLPDIFKQVNITNQPIITNGVNVGEYSIIDGKLRFVFNKNIEDSTVQNGFVGLNLQFNLEKFRENIEQEIHFNDRSEKTLTVIAKPKGDISGITKEGHPDAKHDAREITWTIDVINTNDEEINDATLADIIPAGLGDARDFVIHELNIGFDGDKREGADVTSTLNPSEFPIDLGTIAPFNGYRVQYTTTIENYAVESFTNDATFEYGDQILPAKATVDGLTRSNPIEKNGWQIGETDEIQWQIDVNKNGSLISEAIVEDSLPDGLTVDSIQVVKITQNGGNWAEGEAHKDSFTEFPINLGALGQEDAYRIKFTTKVDWSAVNKGEYQQNNGFLNEATLYDGEDELNDDDATVNIVRDPILEKVEVGNVDYENRTITWEVTVNRAKHPLNDVTVTDTLPAGLSLHVGDIEITGDEGTDFSGVTSSIEAAADGKTLLTINLEDVGTETITIKYTTSIEDFNSNAFTNTVGITGVGVGEGGEERKVTINPRANTYTKSFAGIDYNEKTINWRLNVNPIREDINSGFIIKDTFTNDGLILLPETVSIKLGEETLVAEEDYTVSPIDGGYQNGFTITFNRVIANAELVVNFTTSYDPQLEVDGNVLIPHSNGDEKELYRNKAEFDGTTENGHTIDVEDDASHKVRQDSWNSGKKEGQLVHEDSEGNLVNGWESGSERKIAWQLYTNYQKQDLGTGVVITDTLDYEGTIDKDSITVSVYEVDAKGETKITGPKIDDYSVTVENDKFTLTFNDNFEVKERYVIEFTTTVPDISQQNYTNDATVKVGEKENLFSGTVNYDKYNTFLEKGPVGLTGNEVFTGDEINWEITVNESLSVIKSAVIKDVISKGLIYVEGSLGITKLGGSALVEGDDYSLNVTVNENDETILEIKLLDDLEETLVLNYTTVVTETDGEVNNTVSFNGTGIDEKSVESDELRARQFSWVGGDFNPNRGAIAVTKLDSEEEEVIANNEATFILEFELNGERVQFGEEFTTKNGVLEIGNLPLRTYYLTEVKAPNGYVLADEEIEINVDEPYGKDKKVVEVDFENTKEKTDITGTKVWKGGESLRPDSIQLQLFRDGDAFGEPVTLEDGETEHTWEDLDLTDIDGNEYKYTVDEVDVPDNFEKTISENGLTITNEYIVEQVSISVNKIWEDANDQDGLRPDSITVKLLANDEETDKELTLNAGNGWKDTFTELPATDSKGNEITYTIEEVAVKGYESKVEINEDNPFDFKLTNTHEPELINVEGTKKWDDANNQDGNRPETITVNLLADGKQIDSVEVTEEDNWKYSFTDLPKYKAGEEITYTVTENTVEDYSQEIVGYDITNSYTPEETVVTVTKHWDDANNQDGKRPESIQVQLTAGGEPYGEPVELTQDSNWTHTWSELPLNSNGDPIKYSVKEITELEEYDVAVNDEDHGNIIITNSYTPEVTEVSGAKTWDDADDQDRKRPDSITVNLLANGEQVDTTEEISAENNWQYSFTDLPKFANGEEIEYTVTEDPVENYETTIEGFNITNSYTPETIEVSGEKTWDDANDQDGVRPDSITVNLFANGEQVDSKEVTADDNWEYSFTNLPKNEAGEEIIYTVTENSVEEYTTEIDGTDIINHHKPGKTSATVTKHWDDANNQDGIRPGSIEVQLTADGEAYGEPVELASENDWTYTWDELDEKAAGEAIKYSVIELTDVPKYETSVNDTDHGNIIITNAYTPEVTEVSGTKTWNDADNQDGIRPDSITVNLLANDEFVESKEVTEADNWSYNFSNLPKYKAGEEIIYSITENHVEGYETTIDGFNITNAHTPEEIEINGMKTWDDADNQDGIRPKEIVVNLLANGEHVQSTKVTGADDWKYSFPNLPKFAAGEEILYTVTENSVKDYSQTVEGFNITNAYTPGKTAVTVTKHWDDANNQDGIRPESIEVQLTADGEAYGDPVELASENDWTYTWDELDEKAAGEAIEYSVIELTDVPKYETSVNDTDHGNIIITNAYTPEVTEVSGTKTWNDSDNQDGVRPESITVNLLANGEQVESIEVTEADDWVYSFTNLPKYEAGKKIVYSITEDVVEGYETTINGYDITNTLIPVEPEKPSTPGTDVSTGTDPSDQKDPEKAEPGSGNELPKTATNIYSFAFAGLVLLIVGFATLVIFRRKIEK
ncbi:Cna B-type domain-containing protein [Pseudogracilibacillus sp. SE30717A]|uniref:Cna B-type domain-containing protein n=1 Tax=Pseudogracilibacillus sp. SE30717A TaxID=3098293 RepID=UPI00300DCEAC